MTSPDLSWQPTLFGVLPVSFDAGFSGVERIALDDRAWVDHQPGWVTGADTLFEQILDLRHWRQRSRVMYEKSVQEPRLTAPWSLRSGEPLDPPVLEEMRRVLSARYGVELDTVGFNLYRDGKDGVAWHRDRIPLEVVDPVVVLVSLGERRRFLLRPYGGGRSRAFLLGAGDLLVTGGTAQRTWEHSVPKVTSAGPRISLAFRHGMLSATDEPPAADGPDHVLR